MRKINIPDPRLIHSERTFFDADYSTGTSITVKNSIGFNLNDIAVAGEIGEEQSEAKQVLTTVPPTTVTIASSFDFSHNKGTALYKTVWNQVSIERQPDQGSWEEVQLLDINWSNGETLFFDPSGNGSYNYRFRFFNAFTGLYSEYSPTIDGEGFSRKQAGRMIINARKKVRDPNTDRFEDEDILILLQDGHSEIELNIPKLYFLKVNTFEQGTGIQAIGGVYKYSMNQYSNLNYVSKVQYVYNNGTVTQKWDLIPLDEAEYDGITVNQNRPADDYLRKYKILEPDDNSEIGYIEVYPTALTGSGTIHFIYYRKFTELTNISIETELPFPQILEDYAAWKMHLILGNTDEAAKYESLFYGPDGSSNSQHLTGIALLNKYNTARKKAIGYGRNLIKFRGQRGVNSFWGNGTGTHDYQKENFM